MPGGWVLLFLVFLQLGQPAASLAADVSPGSLEHLQYRVGLGVCEDVARARLVLKPLGPGRYLAEFSGAGQGAWQLLSRWLPERYQTEMAYSQGCLQPLVYREEVQIKGKHVQKEYRFNYTQGRLEYWRGVEHRGLSKQWEIPLKEQVYDPLTILYNLRLGAFGALASGETLRVPGIPTPEPEEIVLHIGEQTGQGLKIMIAVKEKATGRERGPFFLYFGPEEVPTLAWTRIFQCGKIIGRLVGPRVTLDKGLLAPAD